MQLQGKGLHICDGEENPQLSLLLVGQILTEHGREFLKWVLHTQQRHSNEPNDISKSNLILHVMTTITTC